ncbi:MAG: cytochrome c-type biogenesis protein [Porticoccus sp.]
MLKGILKYIIFLQLLVISSSVLSVVEVKEFSSEQMRERFHVLVTELRCPKCQNQNLADSNSPISADLRDEIFRMLEEGKSDGEIIDFLVTRYGEFVMYRPPIKKTTMMLWFMPGVLLLAGIVIIFSVRRRQMIRTTNVDGNATGLAVEEQVRLAKLLADERHRGDAPDLDQANGESK